MLEWTENESYTALRAPALRAEAAALRARADAHAKAVKAGAAPPEPMVAPSRQKVKPSQQPPLHRAFRCWAMCDANQFSVLQWV